MSAARGSWGTPAAVALVLLVTLASRLVVLPASSERTMEPDGPHLLNVARCFERGQGFSNPAAWPAWVRPERLPGPETFKEPGYPYAISVLAPLVRGEFRAAILISLLAGLLLPMAAMVFARQLGLGRGEATLAALLVAASPLSIFMSVRVTVDSLFPALLMVAFVLAAWRPRAGRTLVLDLAAGVAAGLAFMVRGQMLVAAPAFVAALALRRTRRDATLGVVLAAVAAVAAASPFLLRNLRLFGVPFYSDVGAFGLWPYVDHMTFSHGLDRPPAPIGWALAHPAAVLRHMAESLVQFCVFALPQDVLGHPLWVLALAAGVPLALARGRALLPLWIYLGATVGFVFAVNWDSRYFASTVPFWAILAALGAAWVARALGPRPLAGPLRGVHLLVAAAALTFALQAATARRKVERSSPPELEAALAEAPFLQARLAPDEAVMVVTTSVWAWFVDRPAVHLVIADDRRFAAELRRLKVRCAALPTARLAEFAARYPGGRLPAILVVDHVDPGRDVTVFRVIEGER